MPDFEEEPATEGLPPKTDYPFVPDPPPPPLLPPAPQPPQPDRTVDEPTGEGVMREPYPNR